MSPKTQVTQVHVLPAFPQDSPGEGSRDHRTHRSPSGCPRPGRGAVHRFAQTRGCQCPEWSLGARPGTRQELVRAALSRNPKAPAATGFVPQMDLPFTGSIWMPGHANVLTARKAIPASTASLPIMSNKPTR